MSRRRSHAPPAAGLIFGVNPVRELVRVRPGEIDALLAVSGTRAVAPLTAIFRGFMASGISRLSSIFKSPLTSDAPVTWTCSASWKRRSKERPAMP